MGKGVATVIDRQTTRPGWDWDAFRKCWGRGADRIYPVNGEFVISSNDTWLPGSFPTFDAAVKGFANDQ